MHDMEKMKTRYIRQGFVSSLVVILSVTSLALLLLQFTIPAIHRHAFVLLLKSGKVSMGDVYANFTGGASYWTDFVRECLLLSLILTALFSLMRLRLSRPSGNSK